MIESRNERRVMDARCKKDEKTKLKYKLKPAYILLITFYC
jgi:hypothetical protein